MNFQCSRCGVCCQKKNLDTLPIEFPRNPINGNCLHLAADNTCNIYETRPLACRTGELYDEYGKQTEYDRIQWYTVANERCNKMQEDAGLPLEFRIDVSLYQKAS